MCEPVSIGLAVSASYGAVAGVMAGAAVGAAWGVAINAGVNLATGRGAFENAGKAALFGAVSGGIGTYAAPFANVAAMGGGGFLGTAASYAVTGGSAMSIGLSTAAGSLLSAMTPETPDYSQFGYGAQPYETSSQHKQVTGSGGRQAAAVLASEIKQAKKLRSRQAGSEDYGLGMDLAGTGLQIA
jgi:hypothetical protein